MLLMDKPYKDLIRKVGSQSEKPTIKIFNDEIIVGGYQKFTINKKTKKIKFNVKKKNLTILIN